MEMDAPCVTQFKEDQLKMSGSLCGLYFNCLHYDLWLWYGHVVVFTGRRTLKISSSQVEVNSLDTLLGSKSQFLWQIKMHFVGFICLLLCRWSGFLIIHYSTAIQIPLLAYPDRSTRALGHWSRYCVVQMAITQKDWLRYLCLFCHFIFNCGHFFFF